MPQEIHYIKCDCEKGKLEELARTHVQHLPDDPLTNNIVVSQREYTTYYGCNSCDRIFTSKTAHIMGIDSDFRAELLSPFKPYKGKLTREEIKLFAPEYDTIDKDLEKTILAGRKIGEDMLKGLRLRHNI